MNNEHKALQERMERYDVWVAEGKVPAPSRVIPVKKSVESLQWVLPTDQVVEILRSARTFALKNCGCRTRNRNCDKPLEVCFMLNDAADRVVEKGEARYVTLEEAVEALELANRHGLVHLTIYNPEEQVFALCSCCDCCCHDLQIMKEFNRPDFIAHADYVADVDESGCMQCGVCAERCVFGAYEANPQVVFRKDRCYGCGLCVTTCPANAIELKPRI